jgi:hypothetical protein
MRRREHCSNVVVLRYTQKPTFNTYENLQHHWCRSMRWRVAQRRVNQVEGIRVKSNP